MSDDDFLTRPTSLQLGPQLVSYVLGELEPAAQERIDAQMRENPSLADELEEIRTHIKLHQQQRKVAPRRGSFERLVRRMADEGALQGAVPGVHRMLRRAFIISAIAGVLSVVLLALFGRSGQAPAMAKGDVIGQIIYRTASVDPLTERGEEVDHGELLQGKTVNTGPYDATLWVPTGISNAYSTIECSSQTEFKFESARQMTLTRGFTRQLEIEPGGLDERDFIVHTPHCTISVSSGRLSINVLDAETQVTVGRGAAVVVGRQVHINVNAGYCTSVARDGEPAPARPVLDLGLYEIPATPGLVEVTLRNVGFVPAKIRRVLTPQPVYLVTISEAPDYSSPEPAGNRHPPIQVYPKLGAAGQLNEHQGETWLKPGESYSFTADVTPFLLPLGKVEFWLTMKYQGSLYGPQGFARVEVTSKPLRIDMR